jgi:hypothetical protein
MESWLPSPTRFGELLLSSDIRFVTWNTGGRDQAERQSVVPIKCPRCNLGDRPLLAEAEALTTATLVTFLPWTGSIMKRLLPPYLGVVGEHGQKSWGP